MKIIETERLVLRTWKESDILPFSAMNQDQKVMEFFPSTLSPGESATLYQKIIASFEQKGFGLFAVEAKQTQEFVGFIGFSQPTFTSYFTPCVEIGWRLARQFWGRGFATEGAKACLQYGFSALDFMDIYSWTAKINSKSVNVMEKIGLTCDGEFEHPNIPPGHPLRTHVLYKASRNKYVTG